MKILSVNLARAIWQMPFTDINPEGKSLFPFVEWLIKKYNFNKYPSTNNEFDLEKGIKFENGEYQIKGKDKIIVNLAVYGGGIGADTRHSTKESERFLDEILTHVSSEFKLPDYKGIIKGKGYISNLYVSTEKSLEMLNPKLKKFSKFISDNFLCPSYTSTHTHFELGTISFWPEQEKTVNLPLFVFERAVNVPFSENRYFSTSGLETDKHIEALNKLEEILVG